MDNGLNDFLIKLLYFTVIFTIIGISYKAVSHYTINQAHIVCNDIKCEISHINLKTKKVVITEKLDISKIKNFEYRTYGDCRLQGRLRYYIYANRYDGTSYRISPVYVIEKYEDYITVPIAELNQAIKTKPLNIDLYFPAINYFSPSEL